MCDIGNRDLRLRVRTSYARQNGTVVRAEDIKFTNIPHEHGQTTKDIHIPDEASLLRIVLLLEARVDYDKKTLLQELVT